MIDFITTFTIIGILVFFYSLFKEIISIVTK